MRENNREWNGKEWEGVKMTIIERKWDEGRMGR
jgi:hypothetical protein